VVSASQPIYFTSGERDPSSQWAEVWVGPALDTLEKRTVSCLYGEVKHNSSAIQSVAWVLYAVPAHDSKKKEMYKGK